MTGVTVNNMTCNRSQTIFCIFGDICKSLSNLNLSYDLTWLVDVHSGNGPIIRLVMSKRGCEDNVH